jgi:hypothetical protein
MAFRVEWVPVMNECSKVLYCPLVSDLESALQLYGYEVAFLVAEELASLPRVRAPMFNNHAALSSGAKDYSPRAP